MVYESEEMRNKNQKTVDNSKYGEGIECDSRYRMPVRYLLAMQKRIENNFKFEIMEKIFTNRKTIVFQVETFNLFSYFDNMKRIGHFTFCSKLALLTTWNTGIRH